MRSGVTEANLKEAGKMPSAKDRFASLAMIALKVSEQFFMVDVGIKSTGDDFGGILSIIVRISSSVTGNIVQCRTVINRVSKCRGTRWYLTGDRLPKFIDFVSKVISKVST